MRITAGSEEEVRAILGNDAEEEQAERIWREIRTHRDLEKTGRRRVRGGKRRSRPELSAGRMLRYCE